MELLISTSLIAAFVAGIAALFAPCCVTVLLPSYFGSIFETRRKVFLMTFIFFLGILIAMTFGDGAFGILNAFGAEQFPNEARPTGLGLGYGLGATAKIFGPMLLGSLFGKQVTLDSIPSAFGLFAALLVLGGIVYLFAKETKGKSLDSI